MSTTQHTSSASDREVVITRFIDVPRAAVYSAWTDARHLAKWWGPHCFTNPVCEVDARPGGVIRIHMQGPDGAVYPSAGVFQEVVANERLVYSMEAEASAVWEQMSPPPPMVHTILFEDEDGKTKITITARLETVAQRDALVTMGYVEGTTHGLERLETLLAGEADTDTSDREMVITRLINAPRELVYKVWTDPKHVAKWWGPKGFTNTVYEMDVRPGGVWRYMMHGPDGTDYPNRIEYLEVNPPERLVYLHGDDSGSKENQFQGIVTFQEQDGRTNLTLRVIFNSVPQFEEAKQYAVEGGQSTFDCLEEYLAAL